MATKRWRVCNWTDAVLPFTFEDEYGRKANPSAYNYPFNRQRQQNFTGHMNVEITTVEKMIGSNASLRTRNAKETPELVNNNKCDFFDPRMGGANKHFWHTCPHSYENLLAAASDPGAVAYEFNTYDKFVLFAYTPSTWFWAEGRSFETDYWDHNRDSPITIGGYMRPVTCVHDGIHAEFDEVEISWDDARNSYPSGQNLRGHPYHYFPPPAPGVWTQYILDMKPTTSYGDSNYDIARTPYPYEALEGDTANSWFDSILYYYHYMKGASFMGAPPQGKDTYWLYDSGTLYENPHANDEACVEQIFNISGSYVAARNEFHLGFSACKHSTYRVEIRWAFEDMHAATVPGTSSGFDTAGNVPTSHHGSLFASWPEAAGVMPGDRIAAVSEHFWTDAIDTTGQDYVYFAMRPVQADLPSNSTYSESLDLVYPALGDEVFRQICIPVNNLDKPPHLKD